MGIYLGSIILSFLTVPFVVLTKRRFEECLPVAAISAVCFLYIFGILGVLRAAVPILVGLVILAFVTSLFFAIRKKNISDVLVRYFTPGLLLFILFVLVMPFICRSLQLYAWDEYSHWALATKDMYLFDAMPYRQNSYVVMQQYPPFINLFDYLFLKCHGGYAETVLYAAHNLLGMMFLLPLTRRFTRKQWYYIFPTAVIIAAVPMFLFPNYWFELYTDCLMAIAAAYSVTAYFGDEKKDLFSFFSSCLGISFVIMLKNVGLISAFIPVCLLLADWVFVRRKDPNVKRVKRIKQIAYLLISFVLAFGAKGSYEVILAQHGIATTEMQVISRIADALRPDTKLEVQVAPAENLSMTRGIQTERLGAKPVRQSVHVANITAIQEEEETHLGGLLNGAQFLGFDAFVRYWHHDRTLQFGSIRISYWLLYVLLLAAGLWIIAHSRKETDSKSINVCITGLLIGFWIYAVISAFGILFAFNERQASELMGFHRYIGSFYLTMLIVYINLLLQRMEEKNLFIGVLGSFCFALSAVSPRDVFYCVNGFVPGYADRFNETIIMETLDGCNSETDKIAFVSQGNEGLDLNCTRYYAMPLRVSACIGWSFVQDAAAVNDMNTAASPHQWSEALVQQGYTHVYLYETDAYFTSTFAPLFENPNDIRNNTIYEIVRTDGGMLLAAKEP